MNCTFCGAARPLADGSCSNCGHRPLETRALFEQWTQSECVNVDLARVPDGHRYLDGIADYLDGHTETLWRAWKAGTESHGGPIWRPD